MSYQAFLQEIEKGMPSKVYLLSATDPFLHREAVGAIKSLIPDEERDFTFHIFDISSVGKEDISLEQIVDVANTFSFFRKKRFLILENFHKILQKDLKKIESYIANPSPDSVLIMLHEGTLKKGLRESLRKTKCIPLDIRETEIPPWLKQKARLYGLEISDGVADYLMGLIGPDLGLLSAEIDKISLLGKKRIDVNDISDIIVGGGSYNPFDLVDALDKKDPDRAFKIFKSLRETTEVYSLIGVLNWQYGRNLSFIQRTKGHEYLMRVLELLKSADIDIKSSGRNFPMEYLMVKLLRL